MNKECKILWLDDDFDPESRNYRSMCTHKRHVADMLNRCNINASIDLCVYVKEFIAKANDNPTQWDVFIVDINGLMEKSSSVKPEPKDYMYYISSETEKCNALRFCLTGQPNLEPSKDQDPQLIKILKDYCYIEEENGTPYWWKDTQVVSLAHKIINSLNDEFGVFSELRFLSKFMETSDKEQIRQLARWKISNGEVPFPNHQNLRTAIKDGVLKKGLPKGFFCGAANNFKFFEESLSTSLKDSAIENWQRFPIAFLTVLNKEAHSNDQIDNPLLNEMIFNAVLLFSQWLSEFREKFNDNLGDFVNLPSISAKSSTNNDSVKRNDKVSTAPVIQEKETGSNDFKGKITVEKGFLHIEECVISPTVLANSINHYCDAIEVTEYTDNTNPNTCTLYSKYAKKIKLCNK